jgi:hypothetical protein
MNSLHVAARETEAQHISATAKERQSEYLENLGVPDTSHTLTLLTSQQYSTYRVPTFYR